jgi:hypothetical protein
MWRVDHRNVWVKGPRRIDGMPNWNWTGTGVGAYAET